jgi:hypothetical protein
MIKKVMFGVLALTASVYADDGLVAATQKANKSSDQMMMKNDGMKDQNMMMNVVTLTSARPESENGWYLFADALYWHADIGSTDWAQVINSTSLLDIQADNHSLNFKWDWGFRVGIGANIDHDMWDTNFYYTWFSTDNSDSAGRESSSVIDELVGVNTRSYNNGSIKWDIRYSMFDWELGRWHYVSKNLALRPHVGVKGGWINQDINSKFSSPASVQQQQLAVNIHDKFENKFWGVGPSLGLNTMWVLGSAGKIMDHRFALFGDFSGALMYGHYDLSMKQTQLSSGRLTQMITQNGLDRNLATTTLQGIMGLSWDAAFNQGKSHFMMKVGYELQYWFRQNQLLLTGNEFRNNARLSDDLALQGLTAEIRFDF